MTKRLAAVGMAAALAFTVGGAQAADLPKNLTWIAYGTTASGYAQSVAIGNMLKNNFGTTVRVIPGKNDVSRMAPLRDGKADFCACGIAVYFGQEGVFLFASKEWGPQPLRVAATAIGSYNLALATAKDANIKTMADLKGKRVSWVRAGDALNWNVAANLAFAGLSWDDVERIEVSGFKASVDAIINGQSDAAFMSTVTPHAKRLAASPRGIYWPSLPHDDADGWKRLWSRHPVNQQNMAIVGADITKEAPHEGAAYAYPALVSNADQDADVVYALVKAMMENYDDYKDAAPGAKGWTIDNQNLTWALPYHDGAIRYWKEKGMWGDKEQAHQDGLVKRQQVLIDAWNAIPNRDGMSKDELKAAWGKARAAALTKADMTLVFDDVVFK